MLWLRIFFLFIAIPGIADVLIPWLILSAAKKFPVSAWGVFQILGLIIILAGLAVIVWVCLAFVKKGKGTPAPFNPPRQFVSEGLYRWVRNPMYLAAAVVIPLGETIFFQTTWLILYILVLMVCLHLYVVYVEEPSLVHRFGKPYKKYLRVVPRWIPRPPRD